VREYLIPLRDSPRFIIAIPSSLVENDSLLEASIKLGFIARSAAIFRVEGIEIFRDQLDQNYRRNIMLINDVLSYIETPQYLRKRLFKIKKTLKYVGILPPLRTPHHPLINDMKEGEYSFREGVVVSTTNHGSYIDIGLKSPVLVKEPLKKGSRCTLLVRLRGKTIEAKLWSKNRINIYWGYRIRTYGSLQELIENYEEDTLKIATSKYGNIIIDLFKRLYNEFKKKSNVLIIFGSRRGLFEIAESEGMELGKAVDYVINTIPRQGVETVRSEEAILATLSLFNILKYL